MQKMNNQQKFAAMMLVGACVFSLALFTACNNEADDLAGDTNISSPGEISSGEAEPGEAVTVEGEITRIIDNHTLQLEGDWDFFSPELAVVTMADLPPGLEVGDRVQLSGRVHQMDIIEVENHIGWDFQPEIEIELEDVENFLIANALTVVADNEADVELDNE